MRIKKSYENFIPYHVETINVNIRLDANENTNLSLFKLQELNQIRFNRYPDNDLTELIEGISRTYQVDKNQVIAGNGSSELLEMMVKTFVEPNQVVMSFEPSFSMYRVYAKLYDAQFETVPLNEDFSFNVEGMIDLAKKLQPKMIFLCNPNNPTGSILSTEAIKKILNETEAILVVDEAYIEFASKDISMIAEVKLSNRLVVTRTFSKAFGLASIRLGFLVSNQAIIEQLKKVMVPYHLNAMTQKIGVLALQKQQLVFNYAQTIIKERQKLETAFIKLGFKVFHSEGNFIFVNSPVHNLKQKLLEKDILIRDFKGLYNAYYRITVGKPEENKILIQKLKEIIA